MPGWMCGTKQVTANPSSNDELRRAIPKLKSVVTAILRVMLDTRCTENEGIAQVLKQAEELKKQREEPDQGKNGGPDQPAH